MFEKAGYNQNVYGYYYPKVSVPAFRGTTSTQPEIPQKFTTPPDSVEISDKNKVKRTDKKNLSKVQKWTIGIVGTAAALPLLAFGLSKGMTGRISKLYKEKLILSELPEKLEFKDAKTVEEGIKYAKEVLKIKDVDTDFSLDAINYVNRMIVDVSNANKGRLFMPVCLKYIESERALAYVNNDIMSKEFGTLGINKRYFNDEFLTKKLNKILGTNTNTSEKIVEKGVQKTGETVYNNKFMAWSWDAKIVDLSNRFKQNNSALNIAEKRDLLNNLHEGIKRQQNFEELSPFNSIKQNLNLFKKYNIKVNIDEVRKLSTEEQQKKLTELMLELKKSGITPVAKINYVNVNTTVYHEMGHLQDCAKNLKELDLKDLKFSLKEIWKKAKKDVNEGKLFDGHDERMRAVDNRWGGTTYKGYKELLEKNPEKFQAYYPDLYKHLTDEEIQQTAGKVSWYAQTSIGEFIAEVYAKMMYGEKIADDVMALYKKYNGPVLSV